MRPNIRREGCRGISGVNCERLLRLQKQPATYELLIVDELEFVPLTKTGTELPFEIFSFQ